jgi:hypothetical protein
MRKLCLETLIITINYYSIFIYLYTPQQQIDFKDILTLYVNLANKTMHFFLQHLENLVVQTFYRTQSFCSLFVTIHVYVICLIMLSVTFAQFFDIEFCCLLLGSFGIKIGKCYYLALLDRHLFVIHCKDTIPKSRNKYF